MIVTYNTRDLTLPLIEDVLRELGAWPGSEVVCVDNASPDGTADAVEAAFPGVTLVRMQTNVGFGAAVNRGAQGIEATWLLLVNPDARIEDGAVSRLVEVALERPGHGLYGGRFIDLARNTTQNSVAALPTLRSLAAYATLAEPLLRRLGRRTPTERQADAETPIEVDALPGTFVLAETAAWKEVGGFDERFFLYSEDLDLCVRIGRTGRRPLYVPAARLRHEGSASSTSGGKEVLLLKGLVTFLIKHWPPRRAAIGRTLLLVGVAFRRALLIGRRTSTGRWETAWRERKAWFGGY